MESLQIKTGEVRLQILGDDGEERGIFRFNPDDVASARRFIEIKKELTVKHEEFEAKEKLCDSDESRADLLNEIVDYFEKMIDECWGAGTSEILFGDAKSLGMFSDFFEGISPYYAEASKKRVSKYTNK